MKKSLIGLNPTELKEIVSELGMPAFTAKQIADWLYKKRVFSIDEMTNISAKNRELLNESYQVGRSLPEYSRTSTDGTKKYLFGTGSGQYIESVFIPDKERFTLCVSSQAGCKMGCEFCMTGRQGFNGQLTATEILNQIMSVPEADKLTNLVFMGMGEPFDNTNELLRALDVLTADYGYAWSPKRITVSTIGIIPGMKRFLEESTCHLAVSMHTPFAHERLEIMPIEKAYPLQEVLSLIKEYDFSHQRRVSFEYIMFDGYNDSMQHAMETVKLLRGIDCRVNLIRFHAIPDVSLKTSDEKKMIDFRDYLTKNRITCTIRRSRGEDISAACGMLSAKKTTP
ncbi:23S rRNA (adenine(2503)-C(2))-methyltransferase RlmN [Paludibacter sp. 221]|uniref:23S rRNA (adenine(2503)-C(2))-methyltransferase RlmN n=1 Tax=Paludibacter sp. 221 TaxID=2302939 RepID=UPI0013D64840|nr:23S rRNA (adenine(2503)-C(2))-methyltransferase RlmN [Paludibacter sp. 221]NDV46773.1 23S rRNA (adenine(2503)-C(2))-methyltransferase RlmN [Paludibacter sp. 221]